METTVAPPPLLPAARTMLYNAKHIIKYKILKMEF